MWQLIKIELSKIFTRPRSYIGVVAIMILVLVIQLALFIDGEKYISMFLQPLQQNFLIQGKILNGNYVAFFIFHTLIIQMPLLVALVTGDLLSGEAASGTIRLLATKPISRSGIMMSKFIAGSVYTFSLVIWLGILALVGGYIIFGNGDLVVFNSDAIEFLRADDMLWRFALALIAAFISLTVIATLSMMLSSFTDNSIAPIVATMTIVIIFTIIGTLDFPLFNSMSPFLFTTHTIVWREMFSSPLPVNDIVLSISVLLLHIVIFLGITLYNFSRKDILN